MVTLAPACAASFATPSPMPDEPPTTRTFLPSSAPMPHIPFFWTDGDSEQRDAARRWPLWLFRPETAPFCAGLSLNSLPFRPFLAVFRQKIGLVLGLLHLTNYSQSL